MCLYDLRMSNSNLIKLALLEYNVAQFVERQ